MEEVLVNDANILIDLSDIGLLDEVSKMNCRFHTTDLVLAEIKHPGQLCAVERIVESGYLYVKRLEPTELEETVELFTQNISNLSLEDCSVLCYAKRNNFRLITGDRRLRNTAVNDGVIVAGILYLTDRLVEQGIIKRIVMANKLEKLYAKNKRLPKKEIDKRIDEYRKAES